MAKLNLQEKRRIEDLIFSEFDAAEREYRDRRNGVYAKVKEKLLKNPPASVVRQREEILRDEKQIASTQVLLDELRKQRDGKVSSLEKIGYRLSDDERKLDVSSSYYSEKPQELQEFEAQTKAKIQEIERLKKRYVLTVYSDSEEVKGLFDKVSQELSKIVG